MSMPVLGSGRPNANSNGTLPDLASVLGSIDTTGYLFGDEGKDHNPAASPNHKSYLQMNTTDDKFPILVRRSANGNGMELSASSAALDLALSQSPGPDGQSNAWPGYRHRQAQQSLPTNTFRKGSHVDEYDVGQANGGVETTPKKSMAGNRRSVEFNFSPMSAASNRSSYHASPSNGMPKLQQSYSTNDVPTLKNGDAANGVNGSGVNTHAEQHLQNHNVALGRFPQNAMNNRHSRELSAGFKEQDYRQSGLHASAAPFGPSVTSGAPTNGSSASTIGSPTLSQYSTATGTTAPYYGYGMSMLNNAMNGLNMGGPQLGSPPAYNPNGMYAGGGPPPFYAAPYSQYGPNGRMQDSQARVIQSRRMQSGMLPPSVGTIYTNLLDANRFVNYDLKTMPAHEIYTLCKDQHGCRFLQKKLEERNTEYLQIIFNETAPHVVELMTGMSIFVSDCSFANSYRSLWQLPLPETARVYQRRAAQHSRAQRCFFLGTDCTQPARHPRPAEDD
jgi:hypothetical protein